MTTDARKQRYGPEDLDDLLKGARQLFAAKGKKIVELDLGTSLDAESRALLEKLVIGPSGNLRAPAAKTGGTFLVGFNEEMWAKVFG